MEKKKNPGTPWWKIVLYVLAVGVILSIISAILGFRQIALGIGELLGGLIGLAVIIGIPYEVFKRAKAKARKN